MKKGIYFLLIVLAVLLHNSLFAQVHSVQSGKWYWPSVWSNNAVPDSTVDVVLNHAVSDGGSCRNLTINGGGVIWDGGYSIYGNLVNHGRIDATLPAWYDLYVTIKGNIYNTGKYHADYTHFTGPDDQHVSSTDTLKLGIVRDLNPGSAVVFDSTIIVEGGWMDYNQSSLILTDSLTMVNSTIFDCELQGNGNVIEGKPGIFGWSGSISWSPDYTRLNNVILSGTNYLYGWGTEIWGLELHDVVNNGSIYNKHVHTGGQSRVQVSGNFTNNHIIREQQDGLVFEVQGANIKNHGEMRNRGIKFYHDSHFYSDSDSSLGFLNFDAADSSVTVTIENTSTKFKENVSFNFNNGSIVLPENGELVFEKITGSGFVNTNIFANHSELSGTIDGNVTIENAHSFFLLPTGKTNTFKGDLVVTNLLAPKWGSYNTEILVDGNIENQSKIINNSNYNMSLQVTGNIFNNGEWSNSNTTLIGEDDQIIELVNDSLIAGNVDFDAMVEGNSYQWTRNGTDIEGAASRILSFSGISPDNAGDYRCRITRDGGDVFSRVISVNSPSSIETADLKIVRQFKLFQNYPNPFNPVTNIRFSIPEASLVTLSVFDVLGQKVATLINGELGQGIHEVSFSAGSLGSGLYFYKIECKNYSAIRRMMLLK